jgi:hypothetical protein
MTDEIKDEFEAEDWPKGLYMVFATKDHDAVYGKVIGLTRTTAIYHPWDVQFGGVDEEVANQVVLADFDEFTSFDDIWEMEKYFEERQFNLMRGEIQMGEIK